MATLTYQNKLYWQNYQPGAIPSVPELPPESVLANVHGPVLDVGTGDGVLAEHLATLGHTVFGIDIAQNIIAANQSRRSQVAYSVQDITHKTRFASHLFSLILFRFTLTNIHRDAWPGVGREVARLLKPGGQVWLLEPLVSASYSKRYRLAKHFLTEPHSVYVFCAKELAETITTKRQLAEAIGTHQVARIVHHFTRPELIGLFAPLALHHQRVIQITSPSGFTIRTFEGVFVKKG